MPRQRRNQLANPHDVGLAPSRLPKQIQFFGLAALAVLLVVALGYFVTEHWRRGTLVFGVAVLWLAVLRLACDSGVLGVLAVRSRRFDFWFTTGLGCAIVYLAVSIDALGS
ncbi:DUF3017 domain-containing protein [Corynebacterium epidermidicanis]|uniref:Putative DUF3017 family protein n=1 Tax=Corynebacterium epidermidicanis TaxID=1050174 RepID=A0A0G3GMF7_9CORY|nr:DUF3017 domain-containing protein [Corynebacterium epidermidicanis]AKK02416.1 putative DUF3017 family protein [Corynebacterium epidermidicanis]